MENLDLMSVGFGQFYCFLDHLLINVCSNDFEGSDQSFLFFLAEEKLRMSSMSKSSIKAKLSVWWKQIVDFLGEDRNMAKHNKAEI